MNHNNSQIAMLIVCLVLTLNASAQSEHCSDSPVESCLDTRGVFPAKFGIALAIDTFAGADELHYLNPQDSGDIHLRSAGGFTFAYRLLGDADRVRDQNQSDVDWNGKNLWIYGETIHGVRSADTKCQATNAQTTGSNGQSGTASGTSIVSTLPVCQRNLVVPANPTDQLYYILRNATSLEGRAGLRFEFLSLQQNSDIPANLYLKAEAGFLDLAGTSGSALDMHKIALGATATRGRLQDSYLEAGWGRSDVFTTNKRRRLKVDGTLELQLSDPQKADSTATKIASGTSFFARITVDSDLGPGSDAIQSYIGFKFNLTQIATTLSK